MRAPKHHARDFANQARGPAGPGPTGARARARGDRAKPLTSWVEPGTVPTESFESSHGSQEW